MFILNRSFLWKLYDIVVPLESNLIRMYKTVPNTQYVSLVEVS